MVERRGRIARADLPAALDLLRSLPLSVAEVPTIIRAASILETMRLHRLTAYDATYLDSPSGVVSPSRPGTATCLLLPGSWDRIVCRRALSVARRPGARAQAPQPDNHVVAHRQLGPAALADVFDALVATFTDTGMEPDLEDLL